MKMLGWLLIGLGNIVVFCGLLFMNGSYLKNRDWICTESRVIKETLPREEECVQYTRKEGK